VFVVGLLLGRRLATGLLAALIPDAVYTIRMTLSLLRGLELSNCGCYGCRP
jgi:hypothetical protein